MSGSDLLSKSNETQRGKASWNLLVLALAVAGSLGSIYLSIGLGLRACPLCYYQRTFVIAAVLVSGMMLWVDGLQSARACFAALPLAVSGLGIAIFHVYLVQVGKLECPPALLGWGDGPLQSLAIFMALTIASLIGVWLANGRFALAAFLAAVSVGTFTAWACIASAPPLPPAPAQPYDAATQPLDMCRPPYHG